MCAFFSFLRHNTPFIPFHSTFSINLLFTTCLSVHYYFHIFLSSYSFIHISTYHSYSQRSNSYFFTYIFSIARVFIQSIYPFIYFSSHALIISFLVYPFINSPIHLLFFDILTHSIIIHYFINLLFITYVNLFAFHR